MGIYCGQVKKKDFGKYVKNPSNYTEISLLYSDYYMVKNKKDNYGVVRNKKFVVPCKYQEIETLENTKNYIVINWNDELGVVNNKKEVVVPILYYDIEEVYTSDNTFICEDYDGNYGIIKDNEVVLPFEYDSIKKCDFDNEFDDEQIDLVKGELHGLYDFKYGFIIPCIYKEIQTIVPNRNDYFIVKDEKNKYGVVDLRNTTMIPCKYKEIELVNISELSFRIKNFSNRETLVKLKTSYKMEKI